MRAKDVKTTSDFFEFASEWMSKGDTLTCTNENELGDKEFTLQDPTGYVRYRFDETNGLI